MKLGSVSVFFAAPFNGYAGAKIGSLLNSANMVLNIFHFFCFTPFYEALIFY
jgi:hypothetical protein